MSQMMRKQKRSVLPQKRGMKTRDLGQGIRAVMYESSMVAMFLHNPFV